MMFLTRRPIIDMTPTLTRGGVMSPNMNTCTHQYMYM